METLGSKMKCNCQEGPWSCKHTNVHSAHEELWAAINCYTEACGGSPGEWVYGNTRRQTAVAAVEAAVRGIIRESREKDRLYIEQESYSDGHREEDGEP